MAIGRDYCPCCRVGKSIDLGEGKLLLSFCAQLYPFGPSSGHKIVTLQAGWAALDLVSFLYTYFTFLPSCSNMRDPIP